MNVTEEIHIDGARAVELLHAVVAEHGTDTVYMTRNGVGQLCRYVYDGCPDCLVGRALALAGVTVDELAEMDCAYPDGPNGINSVRLPARLHLTRRAREVFAAAQAKQDGGYTWGEALAAAETAASAMNEAGGPR